MFWKTNTSKEDINVKAKVVPFKNIIGAVDDINDTALWALAQAGCDDVMCHWAATSASMPPPIRDSASAQESAEPGTSAGPTVRLRT